MVSLCLAIGFASSSDALGQEKNDPELKLPAPQSWTGETITLPPGFAKDMSVKGTESIRFAPGMFQADSDSFFSYAFVFKLESKPELTQKVLTDEFLKYYRGLSKAVLRDAAAGVDFEQFTLKLSKLKEAESSASVTGLDSYSGKLTWVEPFTTRKQQTLNLRLHTWKRKGKNYVFMCVSPAAADAEIWKQLKKIRSDYVAKVVGHSEE